MNIYAKEFVLNKDENDWNNIEKDLSLMKEFQNYEYLFEYFMKCYELEIQKTIKKEYMKTFIDKKYLQIINHLNGIHKKNIDKIKNMYK